MRLVGPLGLLALALLLAGCSEAPAASVDSAADPTLGTIRGVVVDIAIRPIAAVDVTLLPGGSNAATDDAGAFSFTGLEPGSYALTLRREGYVDQSLTVEVVAGAEPELVRVVLEFLPSDTRHAQTYKFEGYYECGVWPTNGCANVNIVTGIMLCETPVPCFNVTSDRSIFLQWVEPGMVYLQAELVWESTLAGLGDALEFSIGGANRQELAQGVAPAYNYTDGPSPLMLSVDHATLNESGIGMERALLVQVGSGAMRVTPGGCVVADPCGPGVHLQQAFTNFTTTFYGYLPPEGWLFAVDGEVPPPP